VKPSIALLGLGGLLALAFVGGRKAGEMDDQPVVPSDPSEVPPRKKAGKILLLGDSLMVGTQQYVGVPKVGVSQVGRTLVEMLPILKGMPAEAFDAVVISGGLNDLAFSKPMDVFRRSKDLWTLAKSKGWKVAQFALTPFGGGPYATSLDEQDRVSSNVLLREGAKVEGDVRVLPLDETLADQGKPYRLDPIYAAPDKLHWNGLGYKRAAEIVDLWARREVL